MDLLQDGAPGIPVDPNMIKEPRSNPYFRGDDWDDQVAKWVEYTQQKAA